MRKGVLAIGRSRWLALAASLVVSAAIIYAQGINAQGTQPCCPDKPAAGQAAGPSVPPIAAAAPGPTAAPPAGPAPQIASPAEVEKLAAGAPAAAQQFLFPLSPGVANEQRLQVKTIWAARAISVLFPEITTIGGYREDPLPWHPNGLAIDVMIPNHASPEGIQLGNEIAGYALANAKRWGINHVIWRQKIYPGVGAPSWMSNLGNETLNHYDHVHIATNGGGYPTGHETYYIGSMTPAPSE
ncbi:glycoside hydrolase [Mycobacterium sp. UM_CSW]|uniref:glycoside hydrolase n=1 Tax=Mycobacterium sp. UM_CSW TaxID=1370119 RepID=UPI001EF9CBF1|nr:glycoside hydrolase [Mycobacterium sp. UM_CSW]